MEDAAAEHADGLAQLESRLEARIAALQQQVAADMARTADSLQVSLTFLSFFLLPPGLFDFSFFFYSLQVSLTFLFFSLFLFCSAAVSRLPTVSIFNQPSFILC